MKKRYFDVIFSSRSISDNKKTVMKMLKLQEEGNKSFLEKTRKNMGWFNNFLKNKIGKDFNFAMGFNITSSINLIIPQIAPNIIITSEEFPPIVNHLSHFSKIIGIIDATKDLKLRTHFDVKNITLLISHVSYIDGKDILDELLNSDKLLSTLNKYRKLHLIIDGAHAVGNHVLLSDIKNLYYVCKNRLNNLQTFSYIFDFYKWLQGLCGTSVVISNCAKITNTHYFIYPNNNLLKADTPLYSEFCEKPPRSFNPCLVFWLLNIILTKKNLLNLDEIVTNNMKLRQYFKNESHSLLTKNIKIYRPIHTNMLSLYVNKPYIFYKHLFNHNLITHMISPCVIGVGNVKISCPRLIRLSFNSLLLDISDLDFLLDLIKNYNYRL